MKTKLLKLLLMTLVIVIISCSKDSKFTASSFKHSFTLTNGTKIRNDSLKLWNPIGLKFHPDSFLIYSDDDRFLLRIIDLKTNEVQKLIPRGEGIGELMTASNFEINDKCIYVFCPVLGKVIKLTQENDRKFKFSSEFLIEEKGSLRFFPLRKDLFVCLSDMDEESRVTFFNETGKNIKKLYGYPKFLNDSEIKGANSVFQDFITATPDGRFFVLACSAIDIFELYNFEKGLLKTIHGPDGMQINIKKHYSGAAHGYHSSPTFMAYCMAESNEKEIWIGYIGSLYEKEKINTLSDTAPNRILCFDWKGKPIREIKLDKVIFGFDLDWTDKILYAILVDTNDKPEIVAFSLSDILK